MGRRFGTVPGWERAPEFDIKDNRIYEGTPDIITQIPPDIPEVNRHIYEVTFDIRFFFYDSPPDVPVVTRVIKGQTIIQGFDHEYPGGLDKWVSDITNEYANEVWDDSYRELSGLTSSGGDDFIIEITDKKYTPPKPLVPDWVLGQIEYMERLYREAETPDEKMAIRDEINKLKERYGIV